MENKTHAIAVGLFVLILGMTMIFAFWWLSGSREAVSQYRIISDMPVTGLSAESTVKFRGVDVGKVDNIILDPSLKTRIFVDIHVPESLQLSKATYAELKMQGVTGLAFIDLNDTNLTAPRLTSTDTIPLKASIFDQLLAKGPALVNDIEQLLESSNATMQTTQQQLNKLDTDALNKSLVNAAKASEQLQPLLVNANQTLSKLASLASEKNQAQLLKTLSSAEHAAESFRPLITELDLTAKEYRALASDSRKGTSQLAETLNDETLPAIHTLTNAIHYDVRQFGQVLELLEDNPQSILFGNPENRPGPGETGFKSNP